MKSRGELSPGSLMQALSPVRLARPFFEGSVIPEDQWHPVFKGSEVFGPDLARAIRQFHPNDTRAALAKAALLGPDVVTPFSALLDHMQEDHGWTDPHVVSKYRLLIRAIQNGHKVADIEKAMHRAHAKKQMQNPETPRYGDTDFGEPDQHFTKTGKLRIKLARLSFALVSPSQREGSTIREAEENMDSPEMQRLSHLAKHLNAAGLHRGLGFWKDGAEESNLVRVPDAARADKVGSRLGLEFNQKGVVTFKAEPSGPDSAHFIHVKNTDPQKIHDALMSLGVEYKTILPTSNGHLVVVLDDKNEQTPTLKQYATSVGGKHTIIPGNGRFIGANTREEARREYEKELGL